MTAADYKITFPYGATTSPYSAANPHRGNDRACPIGVPIVIAGVTIGKTGATGFVTGAHLHTQAGTDKACQNTFNPTPLEFKPGTVVALRTTDEKAWGKYITIQVGKQFITYAHLSEVRVAVGQVIKEGVSVASFSVDQIKVLAEKGSIPQTAAQLAEGAKKPAYDVALNFLLTVRNRLNGVIAERDEEILALKKQISAEYVPVGQLYIKQ